MELRKYVSEIIEDMRENGEKALRKYMAKFDGYEGGIQPEIQEWSLAENITEEDREVYERIIKRIYDFHEKQIEREFTYIKNGSLYGLKSIPIQRVGLYIPGGKPLPSTVMMTVIPALIAGVKEIVICTPPVGGEVPAEILYLAKRFGVEEIYKIGGIQAIAAMAYGIGMKRVAKIFGPGNSYVNEAKRQVFGDVGIDSLAGPSEVCVVADENSDREYVLNDLMSQREHGKDSRAWLLTTSQELASYCRNGQIEIMIFDTIEECMAKANEIAPEHLEINVSDAIKYLDSVENAGAVYFGKFTPVPCADYFLGTNHVLPTGGASRFSSVLTVDDFRKRIAFASMSEEEFIGERGLGIRMSQIENLEYHGKSLEIRRGKVTGGLL